MEDIVLGVAVAVGLLAWGFAMYMFIWAARKDGEEDLAVQKRLGIRRKTRIGL